MKVSKHHIIISIVLLLLIANYVLFKDTNTYWTNNIFVFIAHIIILYIGVTRYRLSYFSQAISSGQQKGISLTFDDGPNSEYTEQVLEILKRKSVKASFFIIGKNIKGNEKLLKQIDSDGHIIGNHSYSHLKYFNSISPKKISIDIEKASLEIEACINKKPRFFRAPYGLTSPNTAKALKKMELTSVAWDLRSFDTMAKDSTKLLNKLKKKAKNSSILLLHDNNAITLSVLEDFINYCTENGIEIVPLDKMIGISAYSSNDKNIKE